VFGDVHDIGKSLVNTILTNNGYTVIDLGKQVPVDTIINAAVEHEADAIGLSALLVSTSKQMPTCVQELHERRLEFPVLIGGAAINRDFGRRILYPKGKESDEVYEPGVFYCKDAFAGLATVDKLIDDEAREGIVQKFREEARELREKPEVKDDSPPVTDDSVRSDTRTDTPRGEGRGVGAARGRRLRAAARADVARAGLPPPEGQGRLLPLQRRRQRPDRVRPGESGRRAGAAHLPAPAEARPHLPERLLPAGRLRRA
jgi:methylmalonyl-CoA mutase cobalamin-binding domain/chain